METERGGRKEGGRMWSNEDEIDTVDLRGISYLHYFIHTLFHTYIILYGLFAILGITIVFPHDVSTYFSHFFLQIFRPWRSTITTLVSSDFS